MNNAVAAAAIFCSGELKRCFPGCVDYPQVKKIEDSIAFVKARPKPLAIYAFTRDAALRRRIVDETSSGTVTFNDAVVQYAIDGLPFGGVGQSGFGQYHGKYSF